MSIIESGDWMPIILSNQKLMNLKQISINKTTYNRNDNLVCFDVDLVIKDKDNMNKNIEIKGFPYSSVQKIYMAPFDLKFIIDSTNKIIDIYDSTNRKQNDYLYIKIHFMYSL